MGGRMDAVAVLAGRGSAEAPGDSDFGAESPWWILLLAIGAVAVYYWGRRWWDLRDHERIPEKWWPIGLGSELSSGAGRESGAVSVDAAPDLPRHLLSFELSLLAGNRSENHLVALAVMELGARRILLVSGDDVSWLSRQRPEGLVPLLDHLWQACDQELSASSGRGYASASHIGTKLRGGLFSEQERILRWVAEPMVELGLMRPVQVERNGLVDTLWRPLPLGHEVLAWAERIVAETDPQTLAELARTDPRAALVRLQGLPPGLLVLMRPVHPVAREVARDVRKLGVRDIQVDGVYLAGLTEPEVVLGRTDDHPD
jgi:hypothetical protein